MPEFDQIEPIHDTKFTIYNIPLLLKEYWSSSKISPGLYLAHYNEFIPSISIIDLVKKEHYEAPVQISKNPAVGIWLYTNTQKSDPIVSLRCELLAKDFKKSLYHAGKDKA